MCEISDQDWEKFEKGGLELMREYDCKECGVHSRVIIRKDETPKCAHCGSEEIQLLGWHYKD